MVGVGVGDGVGVGVDVGGGGKVGVGVGGVTHDMVDGCIELSVPSGLLTLQYSVLPQVYLSHFVGLFSVIVPPDPWANERNTSLDISETEERSIEKFVDD
jgi:hypothetical protein